MEVDLLIRGGQVVDPAHGLDAVRDVAIAGERIAAVGANLEVGPGAEIIEAAGRLVIPGLVDSHVHISGALEGYFMLARAGVTTCLDMAGMPQPMAEGLAAAHTGLTAGFLYPLTPGGTVSGPDPQAAELKQVIGQAVADGAFGVKILGGHRPLTPAATRCAVRIAHAAGAYCAVHVGSTAHGSDVEGLRELIELADGLPVHIAHINSYCRGQITGEPVEEALMALRMLREARNVQCESYLGLINGTSASIVDGVPVSNVTKTCLRRGGYAVDRLGMEAAIRDGWGRVQGLAGDEWVLLPPAEGLEAFRAAETRVKVSFAVNSPAAAIVLATARREDGRFVVDAISTDGGGHPRNTTLRQGLALVRYGALSVSDLVLKAARTPALMLGLKEKGSLGPGADADVVLVNPIDGTPELVIARGTPVVRDGELLRSKACQRFGLSG